jgi:hypothetical protein
MQAVPDETYETEWAAAVEEGDGNAGTQPDMLLVNAVQHDHPHDHPDRVRLVEMLLQRGVPLEKDVVGTWQTALHFAVCQGDTEVG